MDLQLLVLKATTLLLGAMGIAWVYRRAPGHVHQAWTIAFAAILALPLLAVVLPPLEVPLPSRWSPNPPAAPPAAPLRSAPPVAAMDRIDLAGAASAGPAPTPGESLPHQARRSFVFPTAIAMAKGLWLAGTAPALLTIALSLWRVRRLSASSEEMRDPIWHRSAAAIGRRVGLRYAVRLVLSGQIDTPMAGGFGRPTVFLPMSAVGWSAERRSVVLAHELVHLARRDPLRHLATRLTLALYWFHPLAWIGARWAARACEDACDDAVVRSGIRPSSYARILLEFAESAGRSRASLAAVPIIEPSRLERRLMMILNNEARPVRTRLAFPAVGCALLTMVLAAAQPGASATQAGVVSPRSDARQRVGRPPSVIAPASSSSVGLRPSSDNASPPASTRTRASVPRGPARTASESACAADLIPGGSGPKASETLRRGGMVVGEQLEPRGFARVMQKSFGDLRVCLFAEAAGESTMPSDIVAQAARVILEVQRRGTVQQLELRQVSAGSPGTAWRLNGIGAPVDSTVDAWRHHMIRVLDTTWELGKLRGQAKAMAWDDHERRTRELEDRRQDELIQLRRTIDAKARQAEAISELSAAFPPAALPDPTSAPFTTPSACDLAASWASVDAGGPGGRRRLPRFLHETFGDLRVCLRIDEGNVFETVRPSELIPRAGHAVLEAQRNGLVHRLELTREPDGAVRADWRVNGASRPVDGTVDAWQTRIIDVLDTSWEIFALQGRAGQLLGEMSLVQNRRKVESLRAQIDSLEVDQRTAEWNSLRAGQVEEFRAAMAVIQ